MHAPLATTTVMTAIYTTTNQDLEEAVTLWHARSSTQPAIRSWYLDVTRKRLMNLRLAGRQIGCCHRVQNHARVRIKTGESRHGKRYLQIHSW